jgi:uncharacterized Rmd1/YagE family protein
MASTATESSPLLPTSTTTTASSSSSAPPARPQRTVTFNSIPSEIAPRQAESAGQQRAQTQTQSPPQTQTQASPTFPSQSGPSALSSFHSKLRRRNSHGSPLSQPPMLPVVSKAGPQRTTKNAQKLKLLPNPEEGEEGPDEESGRDVYSQFTRIKDPSARRDAARLGKADRDRLPRVTAYCTANSYRSDGLMKFLKSRTKTRGANPKQFDECIYSPFDYGISKRRKLSSDSQERGGDVIEGAGTLTSLRERRRSDSALEIDEQQQTRREGLIDLTTAAGDTTLDDGSGSMPQALEPEVMSPTPPHLNGSDFDTQVHTPEVFLFDYGTVVIWGMTLAQEQRFLKDIAKFETEKLSEDDVQTEDFNFYYTREYQARIYNDFISLREKRNYMTKLAISHALAQSVKVWPPPVLDYCFQADTHARRHSLKIFFRQQSPTPHPSPFSSPPLAPSIFLERRSTKRSASCSFSESIFTCKAQFSTVQN